MQTAQAIAKYQLHITYSFLIRFSGLIVKKRLGRLGLDMNLVCFDQNLIHYRLSDSMFYLGCCAQVFGP